VAPPTGSAEQVTPPVVAGDLSPGRRWTLP